VFSLTDPNSCQPPNMMQLIDTRMKSSLETVMVPGVSRTASGRRRIGEATGCGGIEEGGRGGGGGVESEGGGVGEVAGRGGVEEGGRGQ
jgi:hypothetical protein